MFDDRSGAWGAISAIILSLGGYLGSGCTRAFSEATLDQQIEVFKQTTDHLVALAERTDAAYSAEFEYDGEDAEAYLKQSAGLRVPLRIRLGVFGNAKPGQSRDGGGESTGFGPMRQQPDALEDAAPDRAPGGGESEPAFGMREPSGSEPSGSGAGSGDGRAGRSSQPQPAARHFQ